MPKIGDNQFILDDETDFEYDEDINVADRIMELNDDLSVEIIEKNIEEQINDRTPGSERMNYITLYREKLEKLFESKELDQELKEEIYDITNHMLSIVSEGLEQRYGILISTDLEDSMLLLPYIENVEALYEFFFVRNYTNLVDLFYVKLLKEKQMFIDRYKSVYNDTDDSDLFVSYSKKKFKNYNDSIIANYITDIIYDIKSLYTSGLDLFNNIVNLDRYEIYNDRMADILVDYGQTISFVTDELAAAKYFDILENKDVLVELRNEILLKYLENVEVDTTYGNN